MVDLAGPAVTLPGRGPRVLLCTEGSVLLRSESGPAAEIGRGGSGFLSAADGPVRASGPAHLFLGQPGTAILKASQLPSAGESRGVLRSAILRSGLASARCRHT